MKDRLRKLIPSREKMREISALGPVVHLFNRPELWHFNRRGVSGAAFIGLFSAFIPVPSQMLLAAIIAIVARVNLPISVALVWITNPITIPPMIYGSYRVGAWVLDIDVAELQVELSILCGAIGSCINGENVDGYAVRKNPRRGMTSVKTGPG